MVRTRSQLENLSKKQLIDKLISTEDKSSKLSDFASRFNDFLRRYETIERIVQLKRNAVSNAQYHLRKSLEINPVPASTRDDILENRVCRALSLTGHELKPDDLQAWHH